jgi:hypothetical protein
MSMFRGLFGARSEEPKKDLPGRENLGGSFTAIPEDSGSEEMKQIKE